MCVQRVVVGVWACTRSLWQPLLAGDSQPCAVPPLFSLPDQNPLRPFLLFWEAEPVRSRTNTIRAGSRRDEETWARCR